jgi:hypothetical protein
MLLTPSSLVQRFPNGSHANLRGQGPLAEVGAARGLRRRRNAALKVAADVTPTTY